MRMGGLLGAPAAYTPARHRVGCTPYTSLGLPRSSLGAGRSPFVERAVIDTPERLLGMLVFDKPAYVPSAAVGTVIRRPPNSTGAVWGLWAGSKRGHRHGHHEGHHRQQHDYALLHALPPFVKGGTTRP
jgi:hypothetical protein